MKYRRTLNNIFTALIMVSLLGFLLAYFEIFNNEIVEGIIQKITLPVALVSAVFMEVVLPAVDNKELFKTDKSFLVKFIVKCLLLAGAVVPLVLNLLGEFTQDSTSEFTVLAIFVVLYMPQFFINLDPKPETEEEDDDYEDEDDDEDDEE